MCDRPDVLPPQPASWSVHATGGFKAALRLPAARVRSKRRRLWDLPERLHCPVVGVCLSVDAIRRLVARINPEQVALSDYECHALCVTAAARRSPLAEQLQEALERRHALAVSQCRQIRQRDGLAQRWQSAKDNGDIAATLWALLTHPLLDADLEETISRDVHMIQHQAGAAVRVDRRANEALAREHAALVREFGKVQTRMTLFAQEKAMQLAQLNEQLLRARGDAARHADTVRQRDAELQALQDAATRIAELEATVARLQTRLATRDAAHRQLQATVAQAKCDADQIRGTAAPPPVPEPATQGAITPALPARTILCVGGRQGSVTVYRDAIEQTGASFLYHDGGLEQGAQVLEAGLSAADVVICQTGCISHHAYWRVKDHCKRHGKQCLYVDTPSQSAIRRELVNFVQTALPGTGKPID